MQIKDFETQYYGEVHTYLVAKTKREVQTFPRSTTIILQILRQMKNCLTKQNIIRNLFVLSYIKILMRNYEGKSQMFLESSEDEQLVNLKETSMTDCGGNLTGCTSVFSERRINYQHVNDN